MRATALGRYLAVPGLMILLWLPPFLLPAPPPDGPESPAAATQAPTLGFPGIRFEGCRGVAGVAELPAELVRPLVPKPLRPETTGVLEGSGLARVEVAAYSCDRGLSPSRVAGPVRVLWTAIRVNADEAPAGPAPARDHEFLFTLVLTDEALARDAATAGLPGRLGAVDEAPGDLGLGSRWTARGPDYELGVRILPDSRDGFDASGPRATWVGAPDPTPLGRDASHLAERGGAGTGHLDATGNDPLATALRGLDAPLRATSLGTAHVQWTR